MNPRPPDPDDACLRAALHRLRADEAQHLHAWVQAELGAAIAALPEGVERRRKALQFLRLFGVPPVATRR